MSSPPLPMHDAEILTLCHLRADLEVFAFDQVAQGSSLDALREKLQRLLSSMRTEAIRSDYARFHEIDMAFHQSLIEAAGVSLLRDLWRKTVDHLGFWSHDTLKTCWPSLMALYREHVLLNEAFQSGDSQLIRESLRQHLEAAWYRLQFARGKLPSSADPAERAAAFLSTHMEKNLTLAWVAKNVCFVSPSRLNRSFRKRFGMSPNPWLQQTRLEKAETLLRQSRELRVGDVAQLVGYRDPSRFIMHFQRNFGMTPHQYRRKNQPADIFQKTARSAKSTKSLRVRLDTVSHSP